MTPTFKHHQLLSDLPPIAHKRLKQYPSGWRCSVGLGGKVRWEQCHAFKTITGAWLPTDPTKILEVAADLNPHRDPGQHQRIALSRHGAAWGASLESTPGTANAKGYYQQFGDDAHEAALRVLRSVCIQLEGE